MYPWFAQMQQQLAGRLMARRLHHALLFIGPAGIGKIGMARQLSKTILCKQPQQSGYCGQCQSCMLFDAGSHPDFNVLESEKQLGVDKIREGSTRLSSTAQLGGNKVLLIPAADSMTEAASNALLKTLEEPTAATFLILLARKQSQLLPTILSRCEKHILGVPPIRDSLDWLKQQGVTDASEALLNAYHKAPLSLLDALNDAEGFSYRQFDEGMAALLAGREDVAVLAGKWQDDARQVVSWCQQRVHDRFLTRHQPRDWQRYQRFIEAQRQLLHPGVNKALILTSVLREVVQGEPQE